MEDVGFVQTDERAISAPRGDGAASRGRARVYARRSERIVRARTLREPQGAVCDLAVLKQLALSLYTRERQPTEDASLPSKPTARVIGRLSF